MTSHASPQLDLPPPVHRPAPDPTYEIRAGQCCRACGVRLAWPGPAGLMFADGTAECHLCADSGRPVP